ncbi:GPI inositol-deacylase [Prorops nasuta]|uniref:GPI inositol-deacylase n=1 Tax=Prorops nasuta TaxID=863751 RepID=UPI0034CD33D2
MISIKSIIFLGILFGFFIANLVLYIFGAFHLITNIEENTCKMTYMFEYPQYVRVSLDSEIENSYPRFGLYAYGEGFITEKLRRMHFTGIPVLFIPGHAGSHKQVRSLASVSLRKSLKDHTPFHFDYFSVSLGEDYSAIYGGVLMEETIYVSYCIKKILTLYKNNMDSIVLIGHSMGGVIAKGSLLLTPIINASYANIIINLGTPYYPPLIPDKTFALYYQNIKNKMNEINKVGVNVVSIGGGPRDILVTGYQSLDPTADINVLSTNVPDVWKSTDHFSILWCNQLILSIVRSLFDCVDISQKPPRISNHIQNRLNALKYHFLHRAAGKKLYEYPEKIQFESDGEWIENGRKQYTWNSSVINYRKPSPIYLMIRLDELIDHISIDTVNLKAKDWLFVCSVSAVRRQSRYCEWGWNLTNRTRLVPDHQYRLRRTVDLSTNDLKVYKSISHILIRIPASELDDRVIINVDSYKKVDRTTSLKNGISKLVLFENFDALKYNLIETSRGHIRYFINLHNIRNGITVELNHKVCSTSFQQSTIAILELIEPWVSTISQIQSLTDTGEKSKTFRLQTIYGFKNETALLRITVSAGCTCNFIIHRNTIIDQLSCVIRDRWPILYSVIISILLLTISITIDHKRSQKPTLIVTLALSIMFNTIIESFAVITFLCILSVLTCCAVVCFGSVARNITVRFLARAITFSTTWSDWLLGGLNQLPFITTVIALSLASATCGALVMILTVILYFLKLTKMYEECLEELLMNSLQQFAWLTRLKIRRKKTNGNIRKNITTQLNLFLLWLFAAVPAIPSALVWAKNFSYERRLSTEDPVLLLSWVIIISCGTLDIVQIPSKYMGLRSEVLANVIRFLSWVILSTASSEHPASYHCHLPPVIAGVIILIALNYLIPYRNKH